MTPRLPTSAGEWARLQKTLSFGPPPFTMSPEVAMALRAIIEALNVPRNRFGKLEGPNTKEMWAVVTQLALPLPSGGEDRVDQAMMILQALVGDTPTPQAAAKPPAPKRKPKPSPEAEKPKPTLFQDATKAVSAAREDLGE